jgi:glycosyltransferase involved in cell wall biosynthesis
MLVGAPVIATAVGGTAELLAHGVHGLLIEPGDLSRLIDAIEAVWSDPGAAAERARAAQDRARGELSFARRERRLLEIYEDVLAQARGAVGDGVELYDGAPS